MRNVLELPPDLPCPLDDGGADHLAGLKVPSVWLEATTATRVSVAFQKPTVLFVYPRAGSPLEENSHQELWDKTPGARGCTPQSCGFRDLYSDFQKRGVDVFGLSVQSPAVQAEFVQRMKLPFPILSDHKYEFTEALQLPTFVFEGERLLKRMALYIADGAIKKVFYPVFPPDRNAAEVLTWLQQA